MDKSLKHLKSQLQFIVRKISWRLEKKSGQSGIIFTISGLSLLRQIIVNIDEIGIFNELTDSLKKSAIFTTSEDVMSIQQVEGQAIISNLESLKMLSTNFLNVLLETVPEEDVNSINIKLPKIKDFDELSRVSRDIHIGLTQLLYNKEIKGKTEIVSVENGSIWMNVLIGSSTALTVVASLVWSAAVIYKKIQEGRLLEQQIKVLKVKKESLDDILKAQKAETELMIQAESENIANQYYKEDIPETIERIKKSISLFAGLIEKGAEIHPALIAPEQVSNLFPDPKQILRIESKIKKIENQ